MVAIVILLGLLVLLVLAKAVSNSVSKLRRATGRIDKRKNEEHEFSPLKMESGQNNCEITSMPVDDKTNDLLNNESRYMFSIKRITCALYD